MPLVGLAERLRAARAAAKLTQGAVSSALGYTPPTIANWEHARSEPGATDLVRLASLYRVCVDWLLTGARMRHRFEVPGAATARIDTCSHGTPIAERCMPCEAVSA